MKSIAELTALREKAKKNLQVRSESSGYKIIIGMATCGIAAGARPVMNAFVEEISKRNIDAPVSMTGCIGVCRLEPIADVIDAEGNKTTYVNLDAKKAERIVLEHLINGNVIKEYTINAENER